MLRQGLTAVVTLALTAALTPLWAADAPAAGGGQTPAQVEAAAPKGTLKNPYTDDNKAIDEQGHQIFMSLSCNGCHGGTGGGGMCPPLINDVWVYGGDDDTLFRLVTLGSVALQAKGYTRRGRENVVGPMPPMGPLFTKADDLWKVITWIRSAYDGDPKYKFGSPPPPPPPPEE